MIDYKEIGKRLAVAVKESPGNGEKDPEVKAQMQFHNAQRIWDIWTQVQMFDPRDQLTAFSTQSGLPDGVIIRYMEVCRNYATERTNERLKQKSPPSSAELKENNSTRRK